MIALSEAVQTLLSQRNVVADSQSFNLVGGDRLEVNSANFRLRRQEYARFEVVFGPYFTKIALTIHQVDGF